MEKNKHPHLEHHNILLEWDAPEFMPTPRGKIWYMVAGFLTAALILYAFSTDNVTMAGVLVLMVIIFLLTEKKAPRDVHVIITDLGVQVGRRFFPYHHINAFWLVYHPPYVRVLYLRLKEGRRYQYLKIELNHQKPQEVRHLLLKEVPEIEGAQELTSDLLARLLRLQ